MQFRHAFSARQPDVASLLSCALFVIHGRLLRSRVAYSDGGGEPFDGNAVRVCKSIKPIKTEGNDFTTLKVDNDLPPRLTSDPGTGGF